VILLGHASGLAVYAVAIARLWLRYAQGLRDGVAGSAQPVRAGFGWDWSPLD